ncbi:polar amino acid ABC transporter permease [Burkholderia sp. SRS-W-2-2016]|uniref:amino acid ABC transporter permease n=1 Tax=Burkholderia sp. SRS-W-2-2016 TaxID=1926878 RepID=UPI00094AE681|nr:amino acid ABC transporter permease [Burkholderia sp. SRS-W-2-2016]OLL31716.1 polar amino acid ABC transporter permease [Burkholderia sp. SRS-W-2-2016]
MSNATRQSGDVIPGPAGNGRRLKMGRAPSVPTSLLLASIAAVALVVAGSWYTVAAMRASFLAAHFDGAWVNALAVVLAVLSIAVVVPVVRALKASARIRDAAARRDLAEARAARSDARDQCFIALGYALAQLVVVVVCQFFLVNHQAVAKTFFAVPLMVKTFPLVLAAFWMNVKISIVTEVLVLIWGLIVALAMFAPGIAGKPVRLIATAYVDIFRAVPAVLVIYLVGFGIPLTGIPVVKDFSLTVFVIVALTLTVGAYVAEIYRAGILSIHWSQNAAARSLGLSHFQTLRFVIVPQGIRQIIPPLLNSFISLQKDTALVSVVGVIDSFNQSMLIASNYYNLSAVSTVALLFIVVSIPQTRFVERMMWRDRARMRAGEA